MGVRTCSEAWSTWQVTCKGGKWTRDLLTTHEKQSFFPTALPFFLNYMTLRPSFIFLSFDTDTGIEILLNYEKNHGMRAMMKGSASVPGRQQGWVGPVLLPQRQLDSHWLLLCGNSSPRLPAISISRKRHKSLRFLTVASKQTKTTPLHGPNGSCLCTGPSPEATSLQPLAFVLLENSSWGVRSGDPRGSPPHTNTLSQQKLLEAHRAYSPLTQGLWGKQVIQWAVVKANSGQQAHCREAASSCHKEEAGTLVWLTPATALEWLTLHSQPQAAQTFLPLSSGPEQFQQHPHLRDDQTALVSCAEGARASRPVGNGGDTKESL